MLGSKEMCKRNTIMYCSGLLLTCGFGFGHLSSSILSNLGLLVLHDFDLRTQAREWPIETDCGSPGSTVDLFSYIQ